MVRKSMPVPVVPGWTNMGSAVIAEVSDSWGAIL